MANTQTFEIIICDQNSTPSLKMGEYLLDKEKGIMYVGSDIPIERVDIKTFVKVAFGATFRSSLQKMFTETIVDIATASYVQTTGNFKLYAIIKLNEVTNVNIGYGTQIPYLSTTFEKI